MLSILKWELKKQFMQKRVFFSIVFLFGLYLTGMFTTGFYMEDQKYLAEIEGPLTDEIIENPDVLLERLEGRDSLENDKSNLIHSIKSLITSADTAATYNQNRVDELETQLQSKQNDALLNKEQEMREKIDPMYITSDRPAAMITNEMKSVAFLFVGLLVLLGLAGMYTKEDELNITPIS